MKFRALVLEEVDRTFPRRNGGEGREQGLSIRDCSTDAARCTNNLTYLFTKSELDRFKGKLRDRFIEVAIKGMRPGFGGVVQCEGEILGVEGPAVDGNGAPGKSKSGS